MNMAGSDEYKLRRGASNEESSEEDSINLDLGEYDNEVFDEDLYGLTAVSLIRDFYVFSTGRGNISIRAVRVAFTILAVYLNIFIQLYLILHVKMLITSKAVRDIRYTYGAYENHMYDGHVTLTVNGHERGKDGYFNKTKFGSMPHDDKEVICQFPLSQPRFFFIILFIWTLTCVAEIKNAVKLLRITFVLVPTVESMQDAVTMESGKGLVVGMTVWVKLIMLFVLIVPRILITGFLLWLGCRWLLATPSFADLVLNAVALEFILAINDLLYRTMIPLRNKIDLANTEVCMDTAGMKVEEANLRVYMMGALWTVVAAVWCWLYMYHLQIVLPGYKFDIHEICVAFLKKEYS